ncbi:hypothetical protein DLAC_11221 [Tieghemostelium lacteum]|uniref:Uncharacterized protein n=1 Tax=Tieghemostelium lacteum TaxID=361077 RepID=A0A151Z3X6_TIELA|nr:hypothetical protein DLAC_11221 [Tieghemostelium lacteum]|eukprot:KYQ88504.1 hypothetical protein DLAC_11221 [Tieghemostelium lacteum]
MAKETIPTIVTNLVESTSTSNNNNNNHTGTSTISSPLAVLSSPQIFNTGSESPQRKVKNTVKDTFSAKILLEMKNFSTSAPSSPVPMQAPLSPSMVLDSSTTTSSTSSGNHMTAPTSPIVVVSHHHSPSIDHHLPPPLPTTPQVASNEHLMSPPTSSATTATPCSFKECLLCKRGTPFVNNQSPTWACIMKIVFYCLQHEMPHKPFLNLKIDVYGFMTCHWHLLCLDKKRSDNWHKQIQDMLSHSKNLFESGMDTYKQNGYWRMRMIADPWEEIKSKKSSHSSGSSAGSVTKRKRSYSENDSSGFSPQPLSSQTTGSVSSSSLIPSSPNPSTTGANSSVNTPIITVQSPISTDTHHHNHIEIIDNPVCSTTSNSTANNSCLMMMSEKSIDKQIQDNFNQLSYQLKMASTSANSIQGMKNTSPNGSKKKLKVHHNNSEQVIPPLPMIPSYLSTGDIPSSPSTSFSSSPRSSPRNGSSTTVTSTHIPTIDDQIMSTLSKNINNNISADINNNSNEIFTTTPQASTSLNSSISSTTSILSHLCDIYHNEQQQRSNTNDSNNSSSTITTSVSAKANNTSLNSSGSNLSLPSSPIQSTSSAQSQADEHSEILLLKSQLKQITENLKSIKDHSQMDKEMLSVMIDKEIERISSLLQQPTASTVVSTVQTSDSMLVDQQSSTTSTPPISNTNTSSSNNNNNNNTVNLSLNLLAENCVPSLSALNALTMASLSDV